MSVTVEQLEGLYLAYFGRPADAGGLAFYLSNPDTDIWAVARAFSESPESKALYGATFSPAVINAIYVNLFNRAAEPAGVTYWSDQVTSGNLSAAAAAFGILLGAQNGDLVTVHNKLAACEAFTNATNTPAAQAGYSGATAALLARLFIQGVSSSSTTRDAAVAYAPQQVAAITGGATLIGVTPLDASVSVQLDAAHPNLLIAHGFASNSMYLPLQVNGLSSESTIELLGASAAGEYSSGYLQTALAADTSSDTLTLRENFSYYDDNNAVSQSRATATVKIGLAGVEHLDFIATATNLAPATGMAGVKADYTIDTLQFESAPQLKTMSVTGDQVVVLTGYAGSMSLLDASALAPMCTRSDLIPQVGFTATVGGAAGATIIGSQHSGNEFFGHDLAFVGGPRTDLFMVSGTSTLTGGAGADVFRFQPSYLDPFAPSHVKITDFSPNTYWNGGTNIESTYGANMYSIDAWNGDVIDLRLFSKGRVIVSVAVRVTQVDQLLAVDDGGGWFVGAMAAILDASSGMLYIDVELDHKADLQIELTGVKTINANAFLMS